MKKAFFIVTSWWIVFSFWAAILLLIGCSVNKNFELTAFEEYGIENEDHSWLERLFNDVFLLESAIFTLWGTKPVTSFPILHYTPEDLQRIEEEFQKLPEEIKKQSIEYEYDLDVNWEKWEKIYPKLPLKNYRFVKRITPTSKYPTVYFINVPKTLEILNKYYRTFRTILGEDFDPVELVNSLENEDSSFWKFFKFHVTTGILYGFGKKNSYLFHWKYTEDIDEISREYVKTFHSGTSEGTFEYLRNLNINNFFIPSFRTFYDTKDPMVEKYSKEREEIQKRYSNHDFVQLTLEKLCR